jgi:uncharacterized membrane protein YcaP (DUF421 family)
MAFHSINWHDLFVFDVPILETVIRGSVMYLFTITIVRITGRRSVGQLGMLDFIFVLLLSIGAGNALVGEHTSIGSGLVLVLTLVAWNVGMNWLGYRFDTIDRFISPPPIQVIRNGELLRRNMRSEFLTENELMTSLREQGCEDYAAVKNAFLEGDGRISVVLRDAPPRTSQ